MSRAVQVIVMVLVVAAVGGGAFWGGIQYGENRLMRDPARLMQQRFTRDGAQLPTGTSREDMQPGEGLGMRSQVPGNAVRQGGGTVGTVESVEDDLVVISTDGGRVRLRVSPETFIEKVMTVGIADLTVGERITVVGTAGDDGTVVARSIQSLRALPENSATQP